MSLNGQRRPALGSKCSGCGSATGVMESDLIILEANSYTQCTYGIRRWDPNAFLDVALEKKMVDMARELLKNHGASPTIDMLIKRCIPNKPDHPETAAYVPLCCGWLGCLHNNEIRDRCTAHQTTMWQVCCPC
jgi:hypothetical protein